MILSYYSSTDKGKTRDYNEDSFLNDEILSLFMVADGMGGLQAGDIASKFALSCILSYLETNSNETNTFSLNTLKKAINCANKTIFNIKKLDSNIKKTGTTLVAYLPSDKQSLALNIGDSRLYRFRNSMLEQITKDHSAEEGLPDFMKGLGGGKFQSIISRALGINPNVEADFYNFDNMAGDIILMCSDGLYSMVSNEEITEILSRECSLKVKGEELVKKANKNGGADNITVTLVSVKSTDNPVLIEYLSPDL
ncbi:MAG: hypothetical protein ACD_79C00352G0005 [uncultured bacterium]|nr:MAG: hypothetical protein ACD_79C00352G0005 [uncultured bacterium]